MGGLGCGWGWRNGWGRWVLAKIHANLSGQRSKQEQKPPFVCDPEKRRLQPSTHQLAIKGFLQVTISQTGWPEGTHTNTHTQSQLLRCGLAIKQTARTFLVVSGRRSHYILTFPHWLLFLPCFTLCVCRGWRLEGS